MSHTNTALHAVQEKPPKDNFNLQPKFDAETPTRRLAPTYHMTVRPMGPREHFDEDELGDVAMHMLAHVNSLFVLIGNLSTDYFAANPEDGASVLSFAAELGQMVEGCASQAVAEMDKALESRRKPNVKDR